MISSYSSSQPVSIPKLPAELIRHVMHYMPAMDVFRTGKCFSSYLVACASDIIQRRLSFIDDYSLVCSAKNVFATEEACSFTARRNNALLDYEGYSVFELDGNSDTGNGALRLTFDSDDDFLPFVEDAEDAVLPFMNLRIHMSLMCLKQDKNVRRAIFPCLQTHVRVKRSQLDDFFLANRPDTLWLSPLQSHNIGLIVEPVDSAPGKYVLNVSSVLVRNDYLLSRIECDLR
ncbi:F-box protein [Schizosaccharomyces japonicus yFS275]|uniref:F-box protein n=1 Tax=Schizosaccharomyces japonicus (strain yFS275 / FY16936) TaxID=402676 RepID=B6JV60_SCHJY|nr:F-box protein [Schizosaccharomyces japonicus yFS275]EEB05261.1 F-box protein [Schizosaccharomyces japonicus yFS275]